MAGVPEGTSGSGTTSGSASPVSADERWESILTEGFASAGIDPNREILPDGDGTYRESEPTATPQPDAVPASSPAVAETPQASAPTGDTGQASTVSATTEAQPPAAPDEPDLTNATPFTYQRADGTAATIEGTYRIPGEGLIVPEDRIQQIESLATRAVQAEVLERHVRELEAQRSTYERLTAWETRNAQGQVNQLTGVPALEQRALVMRRTLAAAQAMGQIFDDPQKLATLINFELGQDGQVYKVANADALEALKTTIKAAALEAELAERQTFSRLAAPPPPPEPSITDVVQSRAQATVDQTVTALKVTGLTDQDKQFLAGHVQRFVRPATPQEQQQGLGRIVMDASWEAFVRDRAQLRADAAKAAAASEQAGKFNAGMNQQKKQPVVPPKAPAQPPAAPSGKASKASAWDSILQQALSEMTPST